MTTHKDLLEKISGGRVLDVATGAGGFIHVLLDGLKDYDEIIGIDMNERGAQAFADSFKDKPIRFETMDATRLNFEDSSFDMVCVSNSLHHLDPLPVLRQMKRILRPNGFFVVSEMYRDNQTETQMTHVLLHHWWAAVDTVNGVLHRETYSRAEILELILQLDLNDVQIADPSDFTDDPKNPEIMDELTPVIDRYIQRAEGHPDLQARGEELRKRTQAIGFHSATTLMAVGRKR